MKSAHRLLLCVAYQLMLLYWRLFRPTTGGAYVAIWSNDRILIIRNSYKRGWTLPAGGQKRNELIQDTALREVREEVAIEIEPHDIHLVGRFQSREEYKYDDVTMFECEFEHEPSFAIDETEVVEAKFISFDEAIQNLSQFTSIARQYFEWKNETRSSVDQASVSFSSATTSAID